MENDKVRFLSASSIRVFEQCRLKFYYNYIERIPTVYSDPLVLGIAVHSALEELYTLMKGKIEFPSESVIESVRKVCIRVLTEKGISSGNILESGMELVDIIISRFNFNEKVIDLEKKFRFFTDGGIPLTGSIDKVVELQDDTVGICDYKTSYVAASQDEIDNDIQLSVYDVAAKELYPKYDKVVLILDYLRHDCIATSRSTKQRKLFKEFLIETNTKIQQLTKENAYPSLNKYCGYCDYRTMCPQYAKIETAESLTSTSFKGFSNDQLIEEWERLKLLKKTLEDRVEDLKFYILEELKDKGVKNLFGAERKLGITQIPRTEYSIDVLSNVLSKEDLLKVVNISNSKVDKFLKLNSEYKPAISRSISKKFSAPIIKISKKY